MIYLDISAVWEREKERERLLLTLMREPWRGTRSASGSWISTRTGSSTRQIWGSTKYWQIFKSALFVTFINLNFDRTVFLNLQAYIASFLIVAMQERLMFYFVNPKQVGGWGVWHPLCSFFCPSTLIFNTITVKFCGF